MDRRTFLKTAAAGGIAALMFDRLPGAEAAAPAPVLPDLAAVRGGEPAAMLDAGLEAMGGIQAFVKPGQTVLIKPNIGWERTPAQAANTNPDLVAHLVRLCLKAGARQVQVFDHTCNKWEGCYQASGIAKAVKAAGGTMLYGHVRRAYMPVRISRGTVMRDAEIFRAVMECDVFINVPILKNHGGAILTASLKNLMGIIWDRPRMHGLGLPQAIADLATVRPPDLNIVDAYRAMQTGGPRGNAASRILKLKSLLISRNMVALDTAAAQMLGISPAAVQHIGFAEKQGLGTGDLKKLNIRKIVLKA